MIRVWILQNSDPQNVYIEISKKQKWVILKKCVFAGQNLVPRRQNVGKHDWRI